MIYIHYYFADFAKKNSTEIFNDAKTSAYFNQKIDQYKKDFSKVRRNMVSGASSTEEAEKLIDALEHDRVLSDSKSLDFQTNFNSQIMTAKQMRDAASVAQTLAQEIEIFLKELNNTINQIATNLNLNLENLTEAIIKDYCEKREVKRGTSEFRQRILQDFLTHEGIKKLGVSIGELGTGQAVLDSSIRNMILLAQALPEYEQGGKTLGKMRYSTSSTVKQGLNYKVSKSGSHTLDIIQNKLQGLLNNVIGTGAEIAWAEAEKIGSAELAGQIFHVDKAIVTGGKNVGIKVKEDSKIAEDVKKKDQVVRISKPDVQVTLSRNNVVIDYGVSVKQYKFNSKTNTETISLVSNTPLLNALEKYGKKDLYLIYNLAAGHASKKEGYSSEDLNRMWENLVKQVIYANFLDALIGLGDLSVLYLVINGKIVPVSDILTKVTEEDITGRFIGNKAVNRNAFVRMNQWIGDEREGTHKDNLAALWRSAETESKIYTRLSQTKLDINLKNLFSFI